MRKELTAALRVTVRCTAAWSAFVALLWTTFSSPLFHLHAHPGETALIHAHFLEHDDHEDESVVHMESNHSHVDARAIDILTTTPTQPIHYDAILVSTPIAIEAASPSCGFVMLAVPTAHGPPVRALRIPRAPPA
jgi:hypothetical protein